MARRNFPFVRQHDGMQCGVACLAMICRHFGMDYSLEQLSSMCTPTAEGVSLKAISDAARELGLESVSARVPKKSGISSGRSHHH